MGEGEGGKRAKSTQHAGGQSVSEKSQVTRTSKNVLEKSNSKTQYFSREVKGRRMTKNGVEFLIGWRDFPLDKDDTWESITNLPVNQTEGDKYVTSSLVLSSFYTCMKNLGEHGSIKKPWFGPANPWCEFPVSSSHESIKAARLSIRQDLEDRWVTNLSEDRKRFFLIASLLDPHTKSLSFCDDIHFPTSWKREGHGFLAMEFKNFYNEIQDTQVDLLHQDASVHQPSALSDLLGDSTYMDVDVDSVEAELNAYTRVQQVPLDTDPLMWWKKDVQDFPRLTRMVSQHQAVPATSASPERLFSSFGLVKSDFRGRILDSTLIDVMWSKQAP